MWSLVINWEHPKWNGGIPAASRLDIGYKKDKGPWTTKAWNLRYLTKPEPVFSNPPLTVLQQQEVTIFLEKCRKAFLRTSQNSMDRAAVSILARQLASIGDDLSTHAVTFSFSAKKGDTNLRKRRALLSRSERKGL